MAHQHHELITSLYRAFQQGDGAAMASVYHGDAVFSDPVFPKLDASQVGAMWRMFCERGENLSVEFSGISADDHVGRAHWDARYSFSATGRPVFNRIDARFKFKDGKIIEHVDSFPFWKWTRMAIGTPGLLLGWTPLVRGKVRKLARKGLTDYMNEMNEPAS